MTLHQQSGAVEACWAHNPEVRGSKPRSAKLFFNVEINEIRTIYATRLHQPPITFFFHYQVDTHAEDTVHDTETICII